ncbi:MAG: hypothetical protein ACJ75B_13105 [Flavisolibacter sp.]
MRRAKYPNPVTMEKNLLEKETPQKSRGFRWLHYLLLFVLIIIAVFLGVWGEHEWQHSLLAEQEQQRHDSLNHSSMNFICEDLREDSARLEAAISSDLEMVNGTDSLLKLIYSLSYPDTVVRKMYYLNKKYQYPLAALDCIPRTSVKLNAGAMDSLLDGKVKDSLINYAEAASTLYHLWERYNTAQQAARTDAFGIFDSEYLFPYHQEDAGNLLTTPQRIVFLSDEPKMLNVYAGKLLYSKNSLEAYISELKLQHSRCIGILCYVRNFIQG